MSRWSFISGTTRPAALSRRVFLRGAGAAIALPWLEAMRPSGSAARAACPEVVGPPTRFFAFYVPNGIQMDQWLPAASGPDYSLTPALASLGPYKDRLNVISGLRNNAAIVPVAGDHARGTGSFLTCQTVVKTEGANISNGISLDQVMAQAVGDCTRFPSLELGIDGGSSVGGCDSGYSCAYARHIAWSDSQTPLPKETNPRELFDRLFADFDQALTAEQVERRRMYRMSILDFVRGDTKALQAKLGAADQQKLDQYLTGIYELEQQISKATDEAVCYPGPKPDAPGDMPQHVRLMADLMTLAAQCDLSRVFTFMLGNAGSGRVYDFLGIGDGHHYLSHHQNDPVKRQALTVIDKWEVEQLAYLLGRLDSVVEGEGTLLDHSAVFFSSEIEDGDSHAHFNLPVLTAGGAGGKLSTGQHLAYTNDEPIADLFVALQQVMGVGSSTFGLDGTGPLAGLLL